MFGIGRKKEEIVVVTNAKDLKKAMDNKVQTIEVRGDLVKKLKWIKRLSPVKIAGLIALFATFPAAAPVKMVSAGAVSAITGTEIATIIVGSGISIALILGILKGYHMEIENGGTVVRFEKK